MPATRKTHHPVPESDFKRQDVLVNTWRVPFLRNIFTACLVLAVFFPFFKWTYLSPAYHRMLNQVNEQVARRTAAHLVQTLDLKARAIDADVLTQAGPQLSEQVRSDLGLDKIKIYDDLGRVLFSTDTAEVGQVNRETYFTGKVAKGRVHSSVATAGSAGAEQAPPGRDVVRVYVPVMRDQVFTGAFELHYDITAVGDSLNALLLRSNLIMVLIALCMMGIVMTVLFKASAAMLNHRIMDDMLHKAHEDLEQRIQDRTHDLLVANKELQLEIIERRQAVEALQQSEKRFRMLVETIPHGIVEIDNGSAITFANAAYAKMYGFREKDMAGKTILDMAASEAERRQLSDHLQFLLEKQPAPSPWFSRDRTADGRFISTQVDWNYKKDVHARVQGLIAVISDITHRKQAEKALLDNLAFMNTMIDTIPNPVFYKDAQGYFLGCNLAYAQTLGLPKEQITGRRLVDLARGRDRDMAEHYHNQDMLLIARSGVQTHEEQVLCADGVLRDYVLYKATFDDAEGAVAGLVGVMLDISDRKKAEKELKESKHLFDAFMENIPGLAYMKDPQGRYMFVNDAFAQFTGRPACDAIPLCNQQIWNEQTARLLEANDNKVFQSLAPANVMETVLLPDGQARQLLTTRFPIFRDEQLFALGGVSIDVTERNQAEQQRQQLELQLQQAQKMEALGTLAGGIAHDFNNILAAIIGYTEIVAADTGKEHPNHHYLVRVLEAGERARALVKQILAFSRQSEIEPKPVQLKLIVKEVLKLLRASLPAFIEINQKIDSEAAVMADPVQIHQVMMNLCTNAGYAMRDKGGLLDVRLTEVALDEDFVRPHADRRPGAYLKLSVRDTGTGIAREHLSRVFEPFFTTKPKGEGTGMGLSVVHGIVTRLGGMITVESAPGQGSCFDVYLPSLKSEPSLAVADAKTLPVGVERILFVDDEIFQTDMLQHMLGLLGYKVTVSNNSPQALALFAKDPMAFDLVITDMIMPEMTGDVLARRILDIRPDLPIILCTGYSENISEPQAKAMGIKAFVLKPLVMQELANLLRQVLDGSGS